VLFSVILTDIKSHFKAVEYVHVSQMECRKKPQNKDRNRSFERVANFKRSGVTLTNWNGHA
jgi:hypothetical protein